MTVSDVNITELENILIEIATHVYWYVIHIQVPKWFVK